MSNQNALAMTLAHTLRRAHFAVKNDKTVKNPGIRQKMRTASFFFVLTSQFDFSICYSGQMWRLDRDQSKEASMSTAISTKKPRAVWDAQVASLPETAADWVLPGFLARGNMTLLTSMWKAGKTTLLAHLLAHRYSGKPLFDLPVSPGKTIVITEEPRSIWADRCRHFNFGGQLCLYAEPFALLPTANEWNDLLQDVATVQAEHQIDLLVIDSLTHFLRAENSASAVLDLLMPIRALAAQGMAVLLMHHPRKQGASTGNAGRGHGSIQSEVDISIEMRLAGLNHDTRARRFYCQSRHADTPRHLQFALNADGTDYTVIARVDADDFSEHWDVLRMVLEDAPQKLTRQDILDEWPDDFPKPAMTALSKWLVNAVAANLIQVEGTGRKADPFRYWVRTAEERWQADPFHKYMEQQARDLRLPFVSLREQKRRQSSEHVSDSSSRIWPPGSPVD